MTTTLNAGSGVPITATAVRELIAELLRSGCAVRFQAHGDSMYPLIRAGDELRVEPAEDVVVGDVVLTMAKRGLTAHRVLSRIDDVIVTRGDNSRSVDLPLHVSRVLGRVVSVKRQQHHYAIERTTSFAITMRRVLRRTRRAAGALGLKQLMPRRLLSITSL